MKAAASSCRTCMKRILSLRTRRASMIPLMPSPGRPKIVSTPQSESDSTKTSDAVVAILYTPHHSARRTRSEPHASETAVLCHTAQRGLTVPLIPKASHSLHQAARLYAVHVLADRDRPVEHAPLFA